MKIDLLSNTDPREQEISLQKLIGVADNPRVASPNSVRSYFGLSHALNEVTRGLARLYPHKRSLAFIKGCGPYFEPLIKYFSMEGYQLQEIPIADVRKNNDWIEALKKDTLFVTMVDDDPLTGELFETQNINSILTSKKIFSVRLSHSAHLTEQTSDLTSDLYGARIFSGTSMCAITILGERASKIEPLFFGDVSWNFAQEFTQAFARPLQNQKLIEDFESRKWAGAKPFFSPGSKRIFDRAVLYWTDMDGEAFVTELSKIKKKSSPKTLAAASLCHWGGLTKMDWLKLQGFNPEMIRGLVVISSSLIDDQLGPAMEAARAEILNLQG